MQIQGASDRLGGLLGVHLENFLSGDGFSFFSPSGMASLPAALLGRVGAVLGLSNLDRVAVTHTVTSVGTSDSGSFKGYGPHEFNSFYNAPAPHPASHGDGFGQTLAILAEGDLTQPRADLAQFENQYGLPARPLDDRTGRRRPLLRHRREHRSGTSTPSTRPPSPRRRRTCSCTRRSR